jgi:hypothetical protein
MLNIFAFTVHSRTMGMGHGETEVKEKKGQRAGGGTAEQEPTGAPSCRWSGFKQFYNIVFRVLSSLC